MVKNFVSSISKLLYSKRLAVGDNPIDPDWELQFRQEIRDFKKRFKGVKSEESTRDLVDDMINKIISREIKAKIPISPINYLEQAISDNDIDWLLKSVREQWVRFNQIYWGQWIDLEIKNTYKSL